MQALGTLVDRRSGCGRSEHLAEVAVDVFIPVYKEPRTIGSESRSHAVHEVNLGFRARRSTISR